VRLTKAEIERERERERQRERETFPFMGLFLICHITCPQLGNPRLIIALGFVPNGKLVSLNKKVNYLLSLGTFIFLPKHPRLTHAPPHLSAGIFLIKY